MKIPAVAGVIANSLLRQIRDAEMAETGAVVEGLGYVSESWAGWRFFLSKSYRKAVIESWKTKSAIHASIEIFFGLFFMALSIFFVIWLIGLAGL